jgi:hypothetical protein
VKMKEIVAARMRANAGCERMSVDSRQQRRARARKAEFQRVTELYAEPRKARRRMALRIVRMSERASVRTERR